MHLISPYAKFSPAIRDVINNPCPVSTIPIELLQEIFAFSVTKRSAPRIRVSVSRDELEPPGFLATALILTWVCSQWRQISLSMPELWGTMTIYNPKKPCVELTKVYLSRSGNVTPLNLHLRQEARPDNRTYPNPETCPEHRATVEIFKLWVPQAHRWRSISLELSYTPPSYELPKIPANVLCSLQKADLRFREKPRHSDIVIGALWENIFQSPLLRTAYWFDLPHALLSAPFSQLSEFKLSHSAADEVLSVLSSCPHLKRLDVIIPFESGVHQIPSESDIILPFLECLYLRGREHPRILGRLSAPALRELRVTDTCETPFAEVDSLERFLHRSCCTLKALRLMRGRRGGENAVFEYFTRASRHLASLEDLDLDWSMLSERVISLFSPGTINNVLSVPFPHLIDLELCDCVAEDGMISSMVESRAAAGSPLWAFVCTAAYGPSNSTGYSKDEAALQRLMQDGLHLCWCQLHEI
ncbi:hypothetical protein BDN72DRAFT_965817 [Pluteus cervinus]|uniref:Uncharacterized protein n=1 Tax=Pluteus cervinus TaxID=181527 RepID=A0ACD3A394_9AGAR|nr:hypothetical protein BDN72DRAFT_965817 [Pluteus cervinus]